MLPSRRLLPLTSAAIATVLGLHAVTLVSSLNAVRDLPGDSAQVLRAFRATASASVLSEARAASVDTPAPAADSQGKPLVDNAPQAKMATDPPPASPSAPPAAPAAAASDESQDLAVLKPHETDTDAGAAMAQREAAVAAAQARLSDRVNQLEALQTKLQALEGDLKARDTANWTGLVKLYEGMRPKDAATIFNSLDKPVLLGILDRMKPAKATPILASMDPDKARQVTSDLADMRTRAVTASN
jgi:flagellar motility protein MotE (MotC chaperone)